MQVAPAVAPGTCATSGSAVAPPRPAGPDAHEPLVALPWTRGSLLRVEGLAVLATVSGVLDDAAEAFPLTTALATCLPVLPIAMLAVLRRGAIVPTTARAPPAFMNLGEGAKTSLATLGRMLWISRLRVCWPPPQVAEQGLHCAHSSLALHGVARPHLLKGPDAPCAVASSVGAYSPRAPLHSTATCSAAAPAIPFSELAIHCGLTRLVNVTKQDLP
eukprot:CAMPEP_0180536992 /NCGR_PEP_ID=MMETSP1036_2-20121128/65576_1 /TAXON_ID=632150 /ORGANISM="Azadinium spinosum, Strain 3D9" /LENGTH=216 /DNA_ID=CAMNT_0022551553 /DNA_START=186 /DNA_END=833 /DNA_ORIENTATION=-